MTSHAQPLVIAGGAVVRPSGVIDPGHVVVDGRGRIIAVGRRRWRGPGRPDVIDATGCWVTPGFIDVQINGGHGVDLTSEPGRADELGRFLPRYGVTSFVPTIITCRRRAAGGRAEVVGRSGRCGRRGGGRPGRAAPRGPDALRAASRGSSSRAARRPGPRSRRRLVAGVRCPDCHAGPGTARRTRLIGELTERGIVVSLGHTDCTAAQFAAGVAAGARYVTHLFNTMRPFAHRDPGPIGAALADGSVVAGLICDGIHVDPVAVRMAWRALGPDRFNLVTDAVAVLGCGPGGRSSVRWRSRSTKAGYAPRAACSPAATCRSTGPCATSSPSPAAPCPTPCARSPPPPPACSTSPIGERWSREPAPM